MRKKLTAALLGIVAFALALTPAIGQQASFSKYAGTYEFEAPDLGLISIFVELTEENILMLSAMDQPPNELRHLDGARFELDSLEMGVIAIGFVEDEEGKVIQMTIDSFEFSFVADKVER